MGNRRGLVLAALVAGWAVAGCGRDSPPSGHAPASWFDCPDLTGDYRVDGIEDARRVVADLVAPEGASTYYLSLVQEAPGRARAILRRPAEDVVLAARVLRLAAPDQYLQWRQQVLIRQGDLPTPPGVPTGESVIASLGPALAVSRELSLGDCSSGWYDLWPMRPLSPASGSAPARWAGVRLSRDKAGALLVRSDIFRENDTGGSFFGQAVTYNSYERSEWRKLAPVAPGSVRFRIERDELPLVSKRARGGYEAVVVRKTGDGLRRSLQSRLGDEVRISILREVQFDSSTIELPAGVARFELAGYYPGDAEADPFTPLLRQDARVSAIEVRKQERLHDGRRYLLLRFDLAVPADDPG